ncbi:helix-turn-helix transcriptional regulator [Streptomyces sp. NPDC006393]|uniref:helix-turn-helix transcriptional regulator n=1 Tax=Streptomyces sp. NPDC006393 TaxID=3156763 RepID=UPI0033E90A65
MRQDPAPGLWPRPSHGKGSPAPTRLSERHLRTLGLKGLEARTYLHLLECGPVPVTAIADALHVGVSEARGAVDRLAQRGLACGGRHGQDAEPVEPSSALQCLTQERTVDVLQAQVAAENAYRNYRQHMPAAGHEDAFEVIADVQISERIEQAERSARHEVLRFVPHPADHEPPSRFATALLTQGVLHRVVYAKAAVEDSAYYREAVRPGVALGIQARVVSALPTELRIYDGRCALLGLTAGARRQRQMLMVRESGLLSALHELFELAWHSAFPMHATGPCPPQLTPMERRILELMSTGMTDEHIARRLDVSRRTLSRYMERLAHRTGTTTRFQLALAASRRGWL